MPNPNKGQFTITGTLATNNKVRVEVLDMLGRTLYVASVPVKENNINYAITISDKVANGVYFIKVSNDDITEVRRFTLER
jgi:hypothetical protein